jgi:hypothetical protein
MCIIYAMYQEDSMGMQGFSPGLSSGEVLDPMPEVNFPLRLCSALKYVCTLLCDPPILTVLAEVSDLEPDDRKAGYFQRWLNKLVTVKLNPSLFENERVKRFTKRHPGVCKVSREPSPLPVLVSSS